MSNNMLMAEFTIGISDYFIKVISADARMALSMGSCHRQFLSPDNTADTVIRVHYGIPPRPGHMKTVFDTDNWWKIDRSEDRYAITTMSIALGLAPVGYAIFDRAFKAGNLYVLPRSRLMTGALARHRAMKSLPGNAAPAWRPLLRSMAPPRARVRDRRAGIRYHPRRIIYSPRIIPGEPPGNAHAICNNFSRAVEPLNPALDMLVLQNIVSKSDGLLFHGCAINDGGDGLLFCGVSGAGKSTLAAMWRDRGATVLGDERVIVRYTEGAFWIYGTPWHRDPSLCAPGRVRLKRIFVIEHAANNTIQPLSGAEAVTKLFVRCFPTFYEKNGLEKILSFLERLTTEIPPYRLGFTLGGDVVGFVRNAG